MKQPNKISNRAARAIAGPLLVVVGGLPMFYCYAFASMINPALSWREYYALLFSKLYLSTASIVTVPMTGVFLVGSFLCVWAIYDAVLS